MMRKNLPKIMGLMAEGQFRKGMDKIIELKAEVLVSSVDGDYLKLPKELAKRLTKEIYWHALKAVAEE